MDADINAAINILHLGVYSPQNLKVECQWILLNFIVFSNHYLQYFFEGTDTIEPVNQHPRYFDLSKVDSHRLIIAERNKVANDKRQSYTKVD